jgi:hypothetical protein
MSEDCVAGGISTYGYALNQKRGRGSIKLVYLVSCSYLINSIQQYGHHSSHPNLLIIKIRLRWPFINNYFSNLIGPLFK